MSRLLKYKDSLIKFIKERTFLTEKEFIPDKQVETFIYTQIKKDSLILPILFLTIMNSQNKKNKVSIQGYSTAASLVFLNILSDMIDNRDESIKTLGQHYESTIVYLINMSYRSLHQNLDSIKRYINSDVANSIFLNMLTFFNDNISTSNLLSKNILEKTENTPAKDLLLWYIKDNDELGKKFLGLKQLGRESFSEYITKKVGSLCELAISAGWIMGCGSEKELHSIKKISKYFTMLYKLAVDFWSISDDLKSINGDTSKNYVINYGLQESYELFMYNKQKFIEETMMSEMYTNTIKEIIDYIEEKVDVIVDETSPDIKSTCSVSK